MKVKIRRPDYRVGLREGLSRQNAALVLGILEEIEHYVINRDFRGFWMRKNPIHQTKEHIKIFGWNPCFMPNTKENECVSKVVNESSYIRLDAEQKRKKIIVALRAFRITKGTTKMIQFMWRYRVVHSSEKGASLHFEKQLDGPSM